MQRGETGCFSHVRKHMWFWKDKNPLYVLQVLENFKMPFKIGSMNIEERDRSQWCTDIPILKN